MLTSDDRLNEEILWVLERIKKESLITSKSKPIKYEYSHIAAAGVPNRDTEEKIIHKLQEWQIIKITNYREPDWRSDYPGRFELEVIQPKFDQTLEIFKKGNDKADKIVKHLSEENIPFVLMVLKQIKKLSDFMTDNEVHYKLQSPSQSSELILERMLLKKLDALDLFKNLGEDGVHGIATLSRLDIKTLDNLITKLTEKYGKPILNQRIEFKDGILRVTLNDNTEEIVDFRNQKNSNSMLQLFTILYNHWQKYKEEPIEVVEIERCLIKVGYDQDVIESQYFMTSTISNIRKKIKGKGLDMIVKIVYNEKEKGYYLSVKFPA